MLDTIQLLVVDDDEIDREALRRILLNSSLSVEITEAETAAQATALLQTQSFDCLLLDYFIPPENGVSLLGRWTKEFDVPPVIMLTGMGDESVAVEAMKCGAKDYIQKSNLNTDVLTNAIYAVIAAKIYHDNQQSRRLELLQMSFYDHLTGLANRNLMMDRLQETIKTSQRNNQSFSLLMMDLDGFKKINDSLGHAAGDNLLKEVSNRMQAVSRESDTVARLGGDEFTMILPDVSDHISAVTVARKIVEAVKRPILIGTNNIQVGISVGVAIFPDHSEDITELMECADKAMYKAKNSQSSYTVFTNNKQDEKANLISQDLTNEFDGNDLILHYQPKVDLITSQLLGAEVLCRWQHPVLGLLPPQEFIPAAESSMMIRRLSYLVIDKALKQQKIWQNTNRSVPLSINMSSRLLTDPNLLNKIESIRKSHGINAHHITFEITESAFIEDPQLAKTVLESITEKGYKISIDDFGTGYSSLNYMRDFPVSEIKIDQTFVQSIQNDVRDKYIIEAIIGLAHAFKAVTIAEGIESQETWSLLRDIGCNQGQGYYIAKPMCAVEFEKWSDATFNQAETELANVKTAEEQVLYSQRL